MRIRVLSAVLVSAALAACGGDSTGPGSEQGLTEADVTAITRALVATGVGVAADGATAAPSASRRSVGAAGSGSFAFDFDTTEPCRPSGNVNAAGDLSGQWDEAARTAALQANALVVHQDCAVRGENGVITLDGDPNVRLTVAATAGAAGITALNITQAGAFSWDKGDGNSGRCTLNVTASLVAGTRNVRVQGTFCGFAVDETGPLGG